LHHEIKIFTEGCSAYYKGFIRGNHYFRQTHTCLTATYPIRRIMQMIFRCEHNFPRSD